MSPLVKALLLLFAAKAASSYMGGSSKSQGDTGPQPSGAPDAKPGTIQTGILKGLPSLESIMERFKRGGHDDKIQSWVGPGENKPIQPQDFSRRLGLRRLTICRGRPGCRATSSSANCPKFSRRSWTN